MCTANECIPELVPFTRAPALICHHLGPPGTSRGSTRTSAPAPRTTSHPRCTRSSWTVGARNMSGNGEKLVLNPWIDCRGPVPAALRDWGRERLGCTELTPLWLSYYVDGCEQALHCDNPHGPWALVLSLTRWDQRRFEGGEVSVALALTLAARLRWTSACGCLNAAKQLAHAGSPLLSSPSDAAPAPLHAVLVGRLRGRAAPRGGRPGRGRGGPLQPPGRLRPPRAPRGGTRAGEWGRGYALEACASGCGVSQIRFTNPFHGGFHHTRLFSSLPLPRAPATPARPAWSSMGGLKSHRPCTGETWTRPRAGRHLTSAHRRGTNGGER